MKIPFLNKTLSSNKIDHSQESIENVIKTLKSSKRLCFETKGNSNSILEEATKKEKNLTEFTLFSMESNDPYLDFKNSMKAMVEAHALQHDWGTLEKLLFLFLKFNVKSNHAFIFAAFVDFLLELALTISKDGVEETPPFSPFYTSNSSSDETLSSSISVRLEEKKNDAVCSLSSLFEMEK